MSTGCETKEKGKQYVVHPDYDSLVSTMSEVTKSVRMLRNLIGIDSDYIDPCTEGSDGSFEFTEKSPLLVRGKYIGGGRIQDVEIDHNTFIWKTKMGLVLEKDKDCVFKCLNVVIHKGDIFLVIDEILDIGYTGDILDVRNITGDFLRSNKKKAMPTDRQSKVMKKEYPDSIILCKKSLKKGNKHKI